ncbi:hypothetical protein XCR_1820 [Xanthomonas campestris pv. raphani 756C]|nr:hypothetical protein XCR_1820 [Xanthomonas campestris pv. raphani 756C]
MAHWTNPQTVSNGASVGRCVGVTEPSGTFTPLIPFNLCVM